ncbi:MAG: AAA family ATPase [Gemmataceae bacterium]
MSFLHQLELMLRARSPLIVVSTIEEGRALGLIRQVCDTIKHPCLTWDLAEGFVPSASGTATLNLRDPLQALEFIDRADGDGLFVLRDFHDCWTSPVVRRKLRSLVQRLPFSRKSLLITTPVVQLPEELRDDAIVLDLAPPGAPELEAVLDRLGKTPGVAIQLTQAGREKMIQAARGLTTSQAQRAFARAIVEGGVLGDRHISRVLEEKRHIVRECAGLEFYPAEGNNADVGGLTQLKHWLALRSRSFTREAREYGLPAPRGIALVGIPGTGKSLVARMIAGSWQMPLFRLDAGALFGSLIGESEDRTRRMLRVAESAAPAVLWIDEIEKALAHGGLDAGTSSRVFATLLTWMQEKTAPVFVVATANDTRQLPAELLRKGRFDEVFFLDLPSAEERREILAVHLRRRGRVPEKFDLNHLAQETDGFVGAELEQAILDAMHLGFNQSREFTSDDIGQAVRRLVPLSVAQRETVEALRNWLKEGRAISASSPPALNLS